MPLTLRCADAADIPAIVKLMNRAFRGTGQDEGWTTEAGYIDGDRTSEAALREELAAKPNAFLMVTDDPTTRAIQACVWLDPDSADNKIGTWYLGSLTVDPRLQQAGLGRTLLQLSEAWARERGATSIRMTVVNVRDTLIAWYERRGYRLTGETHPFPYQDARFGVPRRDDLEFVVLEKSLA